VSLGSEDSFGVTSAGPLLSWGINDSGQLGDGTMTNAASPTPIH
jgi:alpha-tubulin suppressor-like RCC1 family protein